VNEHRIMTYTLDEEIVVNKKPTYEELKKRIEVLEAETTKHNNLLLERILDSSSSISIISTDLNQNVLFWNKGAENIFGYKSEEIVGRKKIDILYSENETKALIKTIRPIISSEKKALNHEIRERTKDGHEVWINLNLTPMVDPEGNVIGVLGIGEDITERKRTEKRFSELSDFLPQPVFETDQKGKLLFANKIAFTLFSYTQEDFDKGINALEMIIAEDRDRALKNMANVMNGTILGPVEYTAVRKDGNTFPILIHSNPLMQDGKVGGLRGILIDISAQKKLETQLRQAQKMEAIGTLAGGIAHDFNNLLMGIQGYTSLMLISTDPSHIHFRHLKGIEESVTSAAELTQQLLGVAKGGKYEVKPVNLNSFVKQSATTFGRTKKEITIHIKTQKNIWMVEIDQAQIGQVLLNLYVNAWQAMFKTGDLYLETQNVTLSDSDVKPYKLEPGNYVKISVTDTGIGMDKTVRERIFDPFFTTKEKSRGTGLGLASAYGIIKNHGGFIDVNSEINKGATFNIYLPASQKEAESESELHQEIQRGSEAILLVDDEKMIIEVSQQMLITLGYTVFLANSGREAVEIFEQKENKIDLVILDMIMPEMGGSETFELLKEINPDIKVLLSSGYSIDGLAKTILAKGCDGFIQKPFGLKDLSQKIRKVIDSN
jgi:two-component system cell cycle sensor histidine kinase/response regulator CckA